MKLPWVECDVGVNGNHFGMEYEFYSKIEGKGNLFSLKLNSFQEYVRKKMLESQVTK